MRFFFIKAKRILILPFYRFNFKSKVGRRKVFPRNKTVYIGILAFLSFLGFPLFFFFLFLHSACLFRLEVLSISVPRL